MLKFFSNSGEIWVNIESILKWSIVQLIFRGLKKCKGPVNKLQNEAIIKDGAVRLLPNLQCTNFHDEYFKKKGYFHLSVEKTV